MYMRKQGKQLSQDKVNLLVSLYQSGKTIKQIQEETGVNKDTISAYLKENGLSVGSRGKRLDKEIVEEIISKYLSGCSICNIASDTGIGRRTVSRYINIYLANNGMERRNDAYRKYTLNEHYFDEIDTPNKAYILGFWYADACNMKSKSTISISLEEHDRDILERMQNELESTRPLEFVKQSERLGKNSPYNYKDLWRLSVFSIHMCEELERKGMPPNKSLILEFPDWLREDLYPHFIRGHFDGDGSFSYNMNINQSIVTITSTQNFCLSLKNYLNRHGVISGGSISDASCHNGVTKVLSIGGNIQTKRFCDWIYKDADLKLGRKYERYKQFCETRTPVA